MNILLIMFKEELQKMGNAADDYTKQKLKARLMPHYKEHLAFHQPPQQSKPEIIYGSSMSIIDVINAASNWSPPDTTSSTTMVKMEADFLDIYSVASRIR